MLTRPLVQSLLCDVILLLELQQQPICLLAIELQEDALQLLQLLFGIDIRHQVQYIQLRWIQLCRHRICPSFILFLPQRYNLFLELQSFMVENTRRQALSRLDFVELIACLRAVIPHLSIKGEEGLGVGEGLLYHSSSQRFTSETDSFVRIWLSSVMVFVLLLSIKSDS